MESAEAEKATWQLSTTRVESQWEINGIRMKPYPLMAFLHAAVDRMRLLQKDLDSKLSSLDEKARITIDIGEAADRHGGWKAETDHLEPTGAQMNAANSVALQLVDIEIVPASFATEKLNRGTLFRLMTKTECVHEANYDDSLATRVVLTFQDGSTVAETVDMPRGVDPPLSVDDVHNNWAKGAGRLLQPQRREIIESNIMSLGILDSIDDLILQLSMDVLNFLE